VTGSKLRARVIRSFKLVRTAVDDSHPRPARTRLFSAAGRLLPIAYCLLPVFFLFAASSEPERLSVYSPQTRYSLPVTTIEGREYVGFFELIEPLTAPELKIEGTKWKLRIPDPKAPGKAAEAEFQEGSAGAKVRGKQVTLSAPARSENGRLMVPLHGVGSVLIPLLGSDLIFHEDSRRMFLAGSAELITSELRKGDPSTLALRFPQRVNPSVSSEGNSLKLSFTRDPVISFSENETLNDKLFKSANFEESNGTATLTISGNEPLLAKFADDGKTILVTSAPAPPKPIVATAPATSQPTQSAQPAPASASNPPATSPSAPAIKAVSPTTPATFLVVIDAAHGGSDTGARITPNLPEKDITLSLARRLRQELQTRNIATEMVRDSDVDVALDRRAVMTNLARPAIFVSLHAEPASTLRIYTPALPSAPAGPTDRGGFLLWQSAQGAFAGDSRSFASAVAGSMAKRELTTQVFAAFVQPLHSIAAPAIAVEAPADKNGLKISEELIAGALAEAIAVRKLSAGATQ
jgi:N-acetylmuramoyl-L-alanine amidase